MIHLIALSKNNHSLSCLGQWAVTGEPSTTKGSTFYTFFSLCQIKINFCSELLGLWGFCPLFGILKTREHNVSETGSVSVLRLMGDA
jgi:hypothetical protein